MALARAAKATRILETGINQGRTAGMLLKNMPEITRYVGIDVPPDTALALPVQKDEVPPIAGQYILGDPRLELIVRPRGSFEVEPDEIGEVDLAFIDGDHSEAGIERDTWLARQCVRNYGLIVWHDYHNLGTVDVKRVLDKWHSEGQRIHHINGTWFAMETVVR